MKSAAFEYELSDCDIAQHPAEPRDSARLLVGSDPVRHSVVRELPGLLGPGDVLVLNDTRVLPARLRLHKASGGAVEVLVLEPVEVDGDDAQWWEALVRPSRRVSVGAELLDPIGIPVLEVGRATGEGTRLVRSVGVPMVALLETRGAVPLPPYITATLDDPDRYQTVYAQRASSVAAPTAGLHLTSSLLDQCREGGVEICRVELSVGIGTFRPMESDTLAGHTMHTERYHVAPEAWATIQAAPRVVAVGTTVVRTLESVAATGALSGRTGLFITPGFEFKAVDALVTNFHMPRSTLLVMVEAFIGPGWRKLYETAAQNGYRFLSFGDAMFLQRRQQP